MNIEVVEGDVKVNAVVLLSDNDDVKIVNIEALDKYYSVSTGQFLSGNGNDYYYVRLYKHNDSEKDATEIRFFCNDYLLNSVDEDAVYDFNIIFTKFDVSKISVLWSHVK